MVFNIGESVAEATNFCLEGHDQLLDDVELDGKLLYKFLVCFCEEGRIKKVPRILKSSFNVLKTMRYEDRADKKTAGRKSRKNAKRKPVFSTMTVSSKHYCF